MMRNIRPLAFLFLALMPPAWAETNRVLPLTLKDAQGLALRNHPKISVAELRALAAKEIVREARSAFFPTVTFSATAAGNGGENTRIAAGGLNNPTVFERNAEGLAITQLITDFGRTANLAASSRLRSKAEDENQQATRAQILVQVAVAYYSALEADAVLRVAQQTVATRQLLLDQVSTLAANKLRSELDVSFARVSFEEARLLLSKSENDLKSARAGLALWLGQRDEPEFRLVEEPLQAGYSTNVSELISAALRDRPELTRLRYEQDAALKFAKAEKALHYPTLAAVGAAGIVPFHDEHLKNDYAAGGVILNFPLFNGMLFSARQKEAALRAKTAEANLLDEENNVIRDVRVAWLNANNAAERMHITEQLLNHASQAFELAEARYKIGSSSIVELSQAQLNKTAAEIAQANAKYEYQIRRALLDFQVGKVEKEKISPGKPEAQIK